MLKLNLKMPVIAMISGVILISASTAAANQAEPRMTQSISGKDAAAVKEVPSKRRIIRETVPYKVQSTHSNSSGQFVKTHNHATGKIKLIRHSVTKSRMPNLFK